MAKTMFMNQILINLCTKRAYMVIQPLSTRWAWELDADHIKTNLLKLMGHCLQLNPIKFKTFNSLHLQLNEIHLK